MVDVHGHRRKIGLLLKFSVRPQVRTLRSFVLVDHTHEVNKMMHAHSQIASALSTILMRSIREVIVGAVGLRR